MKKQITHKQAIRLSNQNTHPAIYVSVNEVDYELMGFRLEDNSKAVFIHEKEPYSIPVQASTKFYKQIK